MRAGLFETFSNISNHHISFREIYPISTYGLAPETETVDNPVEITLNKIVATLTHQYINREQLVFGQNK